MTTRILQFRWRRWAALALEAHHRYGRPRPGSRTVIPRLRYRRRRTGSHPSWRRFRIGSATMAVSRRTETPLRRIRPGTAALPAVGVLFRIDVFGRLAAESATYRTLDAVPAARFRQDLVGGVDWRRRRSGFSQSLGDVVLFLLLGRRFVFVKFIQSQLFPPVQNSFKVLSVETFSKFLKD